MNSAPAGKVQQERFSGIVSVMSNCHCTGTGLAGNVYQIIITKFTCSRFNTGTGLLCLKQDVECC